MLKLFYKALLISVISGSLTTMNLTAYAQEAAANNTSATAQMSKADNSGITRDANGVLKKTETHKFEGTKDDNAIHVITMLAVGIIGTKLLMYKKWTLDMSVVAAASVAYIAAEIVNIMNLKDQLKDMNVEITKSSDGKIDQAQIEMLEKLKESYEKVKKSAKTKKMLQLAAAAAFGGAAAIAAWQRYSEDGKYASCEAGITTGLDELGICSAAGKAAVATGPAGAKAVAEGLQCDTCIAQVTALQTLLTKYKPSRALPGVSVAKFAETNPELLAIETQVKLPCATDPTTGAVALGIKNSFVTPACSTYIGEDILNQAYGLVDITPVGFNPINPASNVEKLLFANFYTIQPEQMSVDHFSGARKLLQKMVDVLIPKAEAGMMAMLGLGAGAAAAFFTAKTVVGKKIDMFLFTPGGRIIAWGILTAAALMGANATQEEMDKIDGHLSKIDQILKDLNTLKSGVKSTNVTEQQIKLAAFNTNPKQDIPFSANPNTKTDCLIASGTSGGCTPLANTIKEMPGFSDLPDSFKTIASQSAQLGDGLSGANSISGSTLSNAASLASKQAAITKLGNSLKNKINDKLSKAGKPKIDFAKEEKSLWNQLKAQTSKALKGNGMSAGAFLASSGISPISGTAVATMAEIPSFKKPATGFGGGATAPTSSKDKNKEFDLDFNENANAVSGAGGDAGKGPLFDIGSNDINTNSGESIFQVISNRYLKSGYPKLFDEIPINK